MGTISCTKHIKTVLDFLHDRCFPRMFLVLPLSNTIPVSINFLCHARIDERDGGSLPYLVLKFRRVCRSNLVSINALCLLLSSSHFLMGSFNSIVIHQLEYLKCNVIKTSITTEYIEQIWRRCISSIGFVMNFWNCTETLWTPCIMEYQKCETRRYFRDI